MTAPIGVCTKDKQDAVGHFWCLKERKGQRSIDNWLPSMDRTVYHNEVCMSRLKLLKATKPLLPVQTGEDVQPHPLKQKNMEHAQAVILGSCRVNCCKNCCNTRH
jgi:hypothetical protein